jgi:methylated-DNA-[protein]-cysteine S-methyltransferase
MYMVRLTNRHIGDVFPVFDDAGRLTEVCLIRPEEFDTAPVKKEHEAVCAYLESYPDGECPLKFDELVFEGRSDFHKTVYKNLFLLPKGEVITYGRLAEISGSKNAARAVGTAMGTNPYPLIVPCHRVVRSDSLGNYSSGVHKKVKLLEAEGAHWK